MATRKNNWLNAKPVTRTGGKSGGARNPAKPYSKPPAKPKPKPPAKPQSKPNSRATAPASNTRPGGGVTMPNSNRAGVNLPNTGVRAQRAATGAMQPRSPMPKAVTKPTVKPPSTVRRAGGSVVASTLLTAAAAKALDTLGKAAKPSEWKRVQKELKDRGYGSGNKTVQKDANGRSSTGVRVSDKANSRDYKAAPTGSQQYNDYRNNQLASERERLKNVGNPPAKPKPPAPTRDRGGNNTSTTTRQSSPSSTPKPRFTGSAEEGRKMWAEKYSSSKYDGQAIQKEAKRLLEKMNKKKEDKSAASKAGWDGNKNY